MLPVVVIKPVTGDPILPPNSPFGLVPSVVVFATKTTLFELVSFGKSSLAIWAPGFPPDACVVPILEIWQGLLELTAVVILVFVPPIGRI